MFFKTTSTWPPPGTETSAIASTPASQVVESHLHCVLRNALGDPPRPRSVCPLLLASRAEAVLRSLPLLVLLPSSLPADQVSYSPIPFRQWMDRVGSPQLEASLVLAGNLQARIQHSHILHSAGKKEIFIGCSYIPVLSTSET